MLARPGRDGLQTDEAPTHFGEVKALVWDALRIWRTRGRDLRESVIARAWKPQLTARVENSLNAHRVVVSTEPARWETTQRARSRIAQIQPILRG